MNAYFIERKWFWFVDCLTRLVRILTQQPAVSLIGFLIGTIRATLILRPRSRHPVFIVIIILNDPSFFAPLSFSRVGSH